MRKEKEKQKQDAISTFIGTKSEIDGNLSFEGTIRVDGKLKGKITSSDGTLIVGETAKIEAEINVGLAVIMGEVTGTVEAKKRIEIYKPARVVGDLQSPVISMDAGVIFNGNCAMGAKTISTEETKGDSIRVVPPGAKEKETGKNL
jgi:cytoskeletal protein CcmA (bactofilin family)